MVLFHVKDRKRSSGFFDGVRNVAGCINYIRMRVSDYCVFNFMSRADTKKLPCVTKDETTYYFIQFIIKAKVCKVEVF